VPEIARATGDPAASVAFASWRRPSGGRSDSPAAGSRRLCPVGAEGDGVTTPAEFPRTGRGARCARSISARRGRKIITGCWRKRPASEPGLSNEVLYQAQYRGAGRSPPRPSISRGGRYACTADSRGAHQDPATGPPQVIRCHQPLMPAPDARIFTLFIPGMRRIRFPSTIAGSTAGVLTATVSRRLRIPTLSACRPIDVAEHLHAAPAPITPRPQPGPVA
jgi:hypothetical protein